MWNIHRHTARDWEAGSPQEELLIWEPGATRKNVTLQTKPLIKRATGRLHDKCLCVACRTSLGLESAARCVCCDREKSGARSEV